MDIDQDINCSIVLAAERIAQLEATNATLRQALSSRDEHIAMLEERLLTMSVELASSRAREDEQRLMLRQSQLSQVTMMSEGDGGKMGPSAVEDKNAPAQTSSNQPRFSFLPGWGSNRTLQDDALHDSGRSQGSGGGVGGIIGNMIQLDKSKSDRSDNLRANFPGGRRGRRRTVMADEDLSAAANSPPQEQRRMTVVGQLFRLGTSERTGDDTAPEIIPEREEDEVDAPRQRRRPNRSKMLKIQASTRLISSTVAFPKEDDSSAFGFDE